MQLKPPTRAAACWREQDRAEPEHVTEEPDATHERRGFSLFLRTSSSAAAGEQDGQDQRRPSSSGAGVRREIVSAAPS